jgi:hypothetical protein
LEKIMSKTNDTEKTRELNDAELAAVSDRSTSAWGAPSVEISADECKILAAAP